MNLSEKLISEIKLNFLKEQVNAGEMVSLTQDQQNNPAEQKLPFW